MGGVDCGGKVEILFLRNYKNNSAAEYKEFVDLVDDYTDQTVKEIRALSE